MRETIIVLDFGGQYNQLVARRVRECNVYCEIYSYRTPLEQIKAMNPKGIILTGGPNSVYEEGAPTATKALFEEMGIPVLGLCYGAQLMQYVLGGNVEKAPVREYGKTETFFDTTSPLFADIPDSSIVWMSHNDYISKAAPGFKSIAHTADCPYAALATDDGRPLYAIQFHPEVLHSVYGKEILFNFVRNICGCAGTWRMDSFVENTIKEVREKVGDGKVLLALSGGVDSSVLAALLAKAVGPQLTCVFVDHGLLRKDEGDEVEGVFGPSGEFDINFIRVNAQERYYGKLAGVEEPERKRKIIGEEFIRVFEEEAKKIGAVDFLAQGTIYPDILESKAGIKSHHNDGGLPEDLNFGLVEPLKYLYKFEVREVGAELGLDSYFLGRHPFPGPGLGVRCLEELTPERIHILQEADDVFIKALRREGLYEKIWQAAVVLLPVRSTGVTDGKRTYDNVVALRAVNSVDAVTAEVVHLPMDFLIEVSQEIIEKVDGVNRVVYDCSPKPPATIEWE